MLSRETLSDCVSVMGQSYYIMEGLHNIDELDLPSEVRRYHVVVTPKDISPKITAPLEYFGANLMRHFLYFTAPS